MNEIYDHRNCQSLFGYAASVHIRSGCVCQLCGCGTKGNVDFDLWRQMTVEHIIGESQGGYLYQITEALSRKYPELSPESLENMAKSIDQANTVTSCSFCNASTSRNRCNISMTELIKTTKGTPSDLVEIIKKELNTILDQKKSVIQWKLASIKRAFETEIRPALEIS